MLKKNKKIYSNVYIYIYIIPCLLLGMSKERLLSSPREENTFQLQLLEDQIDVDAADAGNFRSTIGQRFWESLLVVLILLLGGLCMGFIMLGHVYDVNNDSDINGSFSALPFWGMVVLILLGSLGFMMWVRLLPDALLIDHANARPKQIYLSSGRPHSVSLSFLALTTVITAVGAGVCITEMIQPANTYAATKLVGTADPQFVLIGSFMAIALLFLSFQSGALLVIHWHPKWWTHRSLSRRQWKRLHVVLFILLGLFLM